MKLSLEDEDVLSKHQSSFHHFTDFVIHFVSVELVVRDLLYAKMIL